MSQPKKLPWFFRIHLVIQAVVKRLFGVCCGPPEWCNPIVHPHPGVAGVGVLCRDHEGQHQHRLPQLYWPLARMPRHQVDALVSAQDFQSGISRSQLSHKSPQVNKGIIPGFPWGARSVRRSTSRCIHSKQPPAGERGSPTSTWTRPISTTGWAKPCLYALWMESSPSAWSPFR